MTRRKDQGGGWHGSGFAQKLREHRLARGWTQQQLAESAGLSVATISKLERAQHEPAWPEVLWLAKALGKRSVDFELGDGEALLIPENLPRGPTPKPGSKPRKRGTSKGEDKA